MKHTKFGRIFTSVVAFLLVFTFVFSDLQPLTVYAAGSQTSQGSGTQKPAGGNQTQTGGNKTQVSNKIKEAAQALQKKQLIESELASWAAERKEEREKNPHKETFEKLEETLNLVNSGVEMTISFIKDLADGGDFDTASFLSSALDLASGILNCITPWGAVASAGLSIFKTIFMAAMGGAEAPSEIALMEDRLNQRLDEIANQISEVQDQLSDMSNQINESTEKIISAVSTEIESQGDKEHLRDFMLSSGQGDFSYNQLRNYIYGDIENNRNATTAYYAQLREVQMGGGSSEQIRHYYDLLYSSLVDNRTAFHDYITGDGFGKSIVQTYYDVLSDRPDLTAEMGMSAELAAIQFGYDLYQTEMMMDQLILSCNNYQFTQMVLYEQESYDYGTGTVLYRDILNEQKESVIAQSLKVGMDELRMQFAEDVVYILAITDTYVVEQNGKRYDHVANEIDGTICAQVLENQTLYFNRVPAEATELFDLNTENFRYVGDSIVNDDGIAEINYLNKNGAVTLLYTDTDGKDYTLGSIAYTDGLYETYGGGLGTETSPYLIATAEQFMNIADDMEANYRLVNDINFNASHINPFGYGHNTVDAEIYDEFNGVLDGDGFKLTNLEIQGETHSGIFGKIGGSGTVENLHITFVNVNVSISEAKTTTSTYTGGIIAGTNNGLINSCVVESCQVTVTSETDNADAERSVYFKYGGITGVNNGDIVAAMVRSSRVDVSSIHDFAGASTSGNKNNVFVGGICGTCPGTLNYVGVDEDLELRAYTKSILNPKSTVNPYLKAIAGGITTNEGLDIENISNIYSGAKADKLTVTCALKIESGWGKHWKNAKDKKDEQIPGIEDEKLDEIQATEDEVLAAFTEAEINQVSIVDNTEKYPVGSVELNEEQLEITVNGEKLESFYIINLYGFTGHNESFDQERVVDVMMMFSALIDGETKLLTGTFPITVDKNYVKSISLVNYETNYFKGDAPSTTATVVREDANGTKSTVNNAQITILNADTATSQIGTGNLEVSYQGATCNLEIETLCNVHYRYFDYDNPEHFTFVESVAADCQHGGYDAYLCAGCDEVVKTNRTGTVDHHYVREISQAATCAAPGVIGKIYCSYCETVFEEEVELPRLAHNIVHIDNEDNHYCTQCEKSYAHDYVVSESLVDGQVAYTYTCYSCGYVGQKLDTNIITNEERLRPTVVVSDGYALAAGQLVTLYVDLENNPGVNGANFGIRYDERLELVEWYEGAFFSSTSTEASHSVSCGYNFVWATEAALSEKGGNLLKLIFRVPDNATTDDTYEVAVVYSVVAGSEGGFSLPNDVCATLGIPSNHPQKFKTKDGVIRIVDRLPGDVDNNDAVNLMDALYMSNCLVNEEDYPITTEVKQYGDVNLDASLTINDVVKVLQSISGGYGASLLSPEYWVQLNTNGYSYQPDALLVHLYGANNTYAALAELEQAMMQREGYKFLGWYTRLEGGEKIDAANYHSTLVSYDQDQKVQTLYAHWQKNTVSFDMNGATSDWLDKETYLGEGEQWITLIAPVEEYTVIFVDPNNQNLRRAEKMSRKFAYWLGSDGVQYYAGDKLPVHKLNMGELTLTAQWQDWELNFPALEKAGYDPTQITWYTNIYLTDKLEGDVYEVIKGMSNKVLYADWTAPITYYVHYDANGGSGTMADSVHSYDAATQLSDNAFTNSYTVTFNYGGSGESNTSVTKTHRFLGWSRDGKNLVAENMADNWTTVEGTVITVYALWDEQTITLPTPNAYTGYTFQGWYTDANCTTLAGTGQAGSSFTTTGECTLYAKWAANDYTVLYQLNTMGSAGAAAGNSDQCYTDPTVSVSTGKITFGTTGTYLAVPSTSHYNFAGWYTAPVGGTQITDGTGKVVKADAISNNSTQLYAHWTKAYSGTYIYDEASLRTIGTSGTYHIVRDITMTTDWTPISTFSGVIDGHGHTVDKISYSTRISGTESTENFGFVRVLTGTIKNITFSNLSMTVVKSKDGIHNNNVGGVAGTLSGGTIDNVHMISPGIWCEHHRDVEASGNYVNSRAGAIVGYMSSGTISNCVVDGTGSVYSIAKKATSKADAQAFGGGVVGYMVGGTVTGCSRGDGILVSSQSEVDGKNSASRAVAGGIIGVKDGGSYSGCTSSSNNLKALWDNGSYSKDYSYKQTGAIVGRGG